MPILSNGHVAMQLLSPNVYKNGLYNGEHGLSHRARIPNYSNVIVDSNYSSSYRMNYRHGLFETVIKVENLIHIRHIVYAHRFYTRAIVNEIILTRIGDRLEHPVRVSIRHEPGDTESEDLLFDPPKFSVFKNEQVTSRCGRTRQLEVPEDGERSSKESGFERVCVVWNHVPEEITLDDRATKSYYKFIMTLDRDLLVAEQEIKSGTCWYYAGRYLF